jgi:cyclophilin family peptidyl-prolyl cis-trans isomerase
MTDFRAILLSTLFLALAASQPVAPGLPGDGAAAETEAEDYEVSLEMISPTAVAGGDVRLRITLQAKSGKDFVPAMLDASCFKIDLGGGKVLSPRKEGLKRTPVDLGGDFSISRAVNVGDLLEIEGHRKVKAWWDYGTLSSDKITFRVFQWPLDAVEAVIETEEGDMVAEFFPDKAPRTVANFVGLSMEGFYDGLTFHRVMPGFMIQGGCPNGDGTGDPGYSIEAEFNDTPHERGVLSMARGNEPDSAGCQFFVMHGDAPGLDWQYTAFGRLVSGLDTLDRIAAVETAVNPYNAREKSKPLKPPKILKVTVRLKEGR